MKIARVVPVFVVLVTLIAMFAQPVHADPIVWTLQGVTFDTGATATGSFTYDAATNNYQNVSISVTGSGFLTAKTYPAISDFIFGATANNLSFIQPLLRGQRTLSLTFLSPLTDTGGTIALTGSESIVNIFFGGCICD